VSEGPAQPCPSCEAAASKAARLVLPQRCSEHGVAAPPAWMRAEFDDPAGDLDCLGQWLPYLVGSAVSSGMDGVASVSGDGNKGGTSRNALSGRPDWVDDREKGLARATRALTRLEVLEREGLGHHVAVLWYGHVYCGRELHKTHRGGLLDLVGQRFATDDMRAHWKKQKSKIASARAVQDYGEQLLALACAVYRGESVPAPDPVATTAPKDPDPARADFSPASLASLSASLGGLIREAMGAPTCDFPRRVGGTGGVGGGSRGPGEVGGAGSLSRRTEVRPMSHWTELKVIWKASQIAAQMHCGERTVRDWFELGLIPGAFKTAGGHHRVSGTNLRLFLNGTASMPTPPPAAPAARAA
jgi:hypothetical protein